MLIIDSHMFISCKLAYRSSNHASIYKCVDIDNIPLIPWTPTSASAILFLDQCKKYSNPGALYRDGMVFILFIVCLKIIYSNILCLFLICFHFQKTFFHIEDDNVGLEKIRLSAEMGHIHSMFALGIILLYYGGEGIIKGSSVLRELKRLCASNAIEVTKCRIKFRRFLGLTWKGCFTYPVYRPKCCTTSSHCVFCVDEQKFIYSVPNCELCQCDMELDEIL